MDVRRQLSFTVVCAATVALDLWIAANHIDWWLAGVGPTSQLGWYGMRAAGVGVGLAVLLSLRASTPATHGLAGPFPVGAGHAIRRLCAWAVGLYVLLLGVGVLAVRAGWFDPTSLPRDLASRGGVFGSLLLMCVAAPIVEEAVYRGMAVPALRAHVGPRVTVFLSGLLFWGLHVAYGYPPWLLHYPIAGMVLAWAFLRTRRLWVAVLLHALGNLLMVADDLLRLYAPELVRQLLGSHGAGFV